MAEHDESQLEELDEYRVTPLELFFDLVFVFALTQVTSLVARDLTWMGLLRGLAVLMAVWWAWVGYSWLTNAVPIEDDDRARVVMLCAMSAMLVLGLSIPNAFGVMLALGLKKVLSFGGDPLNTVAAVTLFGGVALYLVGHGAFRWRNIRSIAGQRVIAVILLVALIPVGTWVSAYLSLLLVAIVTAGLVAYEAVRYRELREWVRQSR